MPRLRDAPLRGVVVTISVLCAVVLAPTAASAEVIPGRYIVVLNDAADAAVVEGKHARSGARIRKRFRQAFKGYAADLSASALAAVKADVAVDFVSQAQRFRRPRQRRRLAEQEPQVATRWLRRIGAPLSSTLSGDGQGRVNVNVAVLDGGVDKRSLELRISGGHNCIGHNPNAWQDLDGHGTFIAGVIGALDDGGGIVGIAPGAKIWGVRVADFNGFLTDEDLFCGLEWIASTRTDTDPQNDIQVVNGSFGGQNLADDENCGRTSGDAIHFAFCRLNRLGVTSVVAAGNDAADSSMNYTPSSYDEVLNVTAMSDFDGLPGGQVPPPVCGGIDYSQYNVIDDGPADFSNWVTLANDQAHTVAAPGICIGSILPRAICGPQSLSCYALAEGTSFAAPMAAGTVALCIASGPCAGLRPAQIIRKIVADARDYNIANPGYGFLGDPLRPIGDRYYGYLIRAGLY